MNDEEFIRFAQLFNATPEQAEEYGQYLSQDPDSWNQHEAQIDTLFNYDDCLPDELEDCRDRIFECSELYSRKEYSQAQRHAPQQSSYPLFESVQNAVILGLSSIRNRRAT